MLQKTGELNGLVRGEAVEIFSLKIKSFLTCWVDPIFRSGII